MLKILKKLKPADLTARFLAIFILPIIIIQLVGIYFFFERHLQSYTRNMLSSLTNEMALIVSNKNFGIQTQEIEEYLDITIENATFITEKGKRLSSLERSIASKIQNIKNVLAYKKNDKLHVYIIFNNDIIYKLTAPEKRLYNSSSYIFVLWVIGSSLFFGIIAFIFLKNQIRSILNFTKMAENLGKNKDISQSLKPSGAKQIRSATIASIEMHERIKKLIDTRKEFNNNFKKEVRLIQKELQKQKTNKNLISEKLNNLINNLEE